MRLAIRQDSLIIKETDGLAEQLNDFWPIKLLLQQKLEKYFTNHRSYATCYFTQVVMASLRSIAIKSPLSSLVKPS